MVRDEVWIRASKQENQMAKFKNWAQWTPWAGLAAMAAVLLLSGHWSVPGDFWFKKQMGSPVALSWSVSGEAKTGALISNGLSEEPLKFAFNAGAGGVEYLESRHVVALRCKVEGGGDWESTAGTLGEAGNLKRFGQGYMLEASPGARFECEQKSTGPAKISVRDLSQAEALEAQFSYESKNDVLLVAFGLVIAFSLVTSLVNKNKSYALFAFFLFINYRLAQLSNGSDLALGWWEFSREWMPRIRMVTTALGVLLTVRLFEDLLAGAFKKESKGLAWAGASAKWASAVLLLASMVFPFKFYLPYLWCVSAWVGVVLTMRVAGLASRNGELGWGPVVTGLGIFAPLMFGLSEIGAAALGFSQLLEYVNHQSGAIVTSWVSALAFAVQLRDQAGKAKKAQEELNASYVASPMGLFLASQEGEVVQGNPALASKFGESKMQGWSMVDHFAGQWESFVEKLRSAEGALDTTVEVLSTDGQVRWLDVRAKLDKKGQIEGALMDSTERVLHKKRLEFLASHDPLTECLNLRGLEKLLDKLDGSGDSAAVAAYLDLDRFKLVNDVYGHEAGDQVLKEVKKRLMDKIGGTGELCRVGGDEFLILFKDEPMDQAQLICQKALEALANQPYVYGDKSFRISASAGLVEAKAIGASTSRSLIGAADSACRMAKQKGEGSLVAYGRDSMFFDRRLESFEIAKMLEKEKLPEGLYLLAQPIMSLSTPFDSLNFEMLMRLRMPDGREIGAGPLIETAEAHGYIGRLDYWMVERMIGWIKANIPSLALTKFICVNFSGGSLNDEAFLKKVFDLFEKNKIEAQLLCVEITESVALRDLGNTRKFVERCRAMGVKVALDDFGAGYSSFGYLRELPADALKVDGLLVRDAMNNEATQSILIALSGLSKALGMRTVGEWAENCQMVKLLSMAGFDYVQGYAVAKPMPLDELLKAKSCADLIVDNETLLFARYLQQGAPSPVLGDSAESTWLH